MSGSLRLDAKFPTIEQEAPQLVSPARAVEVFAQDNHVFLRVGAVDGADATQGSYTLLLDADAAAKIVTALQEATRDLDKITETEHI